MARARHGSGFGGGASGACSGDGLGELPVADHRRARDLVFPAEPALAYVATHRAGDGGSVVDRAPAKAIRAPKRETRRRAAEARGARGSAVGKEVPR